MATFNVSVEDSSPLISYNPSNAWVDTPANDPLASSYSGGSFHATTAQGATATIQFNGTGLSIYGGRRPNYGAFSITVDGRTIASADATSSTATAQQLLGTVSGLSNTLHTAVLTNGGSGIDIDRIDFVSEIESGKSSVTSRTFDDSDTQMSYQPSSAWSINNRPDFINGTLHFTNSSSAQVSFQFSGDAVAVYGTTAPDHADIQVSLDGRSQTLPGGSSGRISSLRTKTLLYYASNLGSQQHSIVLSGVPRPNAPFMDLDAITVYSALGATNNQGDGQSDAPINSGPTSTPNDADSSNSSSIPTEAIIGASVGGAVVLLLLFAMLLICLRRRRKRDVAEVEPVTPGSPQLPLQRPTSVASPRSPAWSFVAGSGSQQPFSADQHRRQISVASSAKSTTPMMQNVPLIREPTPARASNLSNTTTASAYSNMPMRPLRPPTLDYGTWSERDAYGGTA